MPSPRAQRRIRRWSRATDRHPSRRRPRRALRRRQAAGAAAVGFARRQRRHGRRRGRLPCISSPRCPTVIAVVRPGDSMLARRAARDRGAGRRVRARRRRHGCEPCLRCRRGSRTPTAGSSRSRTCRGSRPSSIVTVADALRGGADIAAPSYHRRARTSGGIRAQHYADAGGAFRRRRRALDRGRASRQRAIDRRRRQPACCATSTRPTTCGPLSASALAYSSGFALPQIGLAVAAVAQLLLHAPPRAQLASGSGWAMR